MPDARTAARIESWFGVTDDFERPAGPVSGRDYALFGAITVFSLLMLEFSRGAGALDQTTASVPVEWATVVSGVALLIWRRRWPLLVAALAAAHMFVTGVTMPQVMTQPSLQIVYFFAIFSAVAWARDRRAMLLVISAILVFMFTWIAWQMAVGAGIDTWLESEDFRSEGVFGPVVSMVMSTLLINALYFGGAIAIGAHAWRTARQQTQVAEQAATIAQQAGQLRDQAVIEERLRIARELHDVVAHHVSAMGVQAGAARRVLAKDPTVAAAALAYIEDASRDAVTQMRGLLGTLRDTGTEPSDSRSTDPGVEDLQQLIEAAAQQGVDAHLDLVERPAGLTVTLPRGVGLSIYRTVQEALTNVARHSTATRASVVVRLDAEAAPPYAEVEIVDDGRPRPATSGSGLGQLGIRERAASHRGQVEIGPRITGGYRVRVRFPLGETQ